MDILTTDTPTFFKSPFSGILTSFRFLWFQGPLGVFNDRHGLLPDPREPCWHAIQPSPGSTFFQLRSYFVSRVDVQVTPGDGDRVHGNGS